MSRASSAWCEEGKIFVSSYIKKKKNYRINCRYTVMDLGWVETGEGLRVMVFGILRMKLELRNFVNPKSCLAFHCSRYSSYFVYFSCGGDGDVRVFRPPWHFSEKSEAGETESSTSRSELGQLLSW